MTSVYINSSYNNQAKPSNLEAILAKAKTGDSEAFSEIYDLFFKKIYRFIFFRVSHKETAEDLAEEVFLKAFGKLGSINDSSAFEGWLYQIARNLVIDYYRQKKITVSLDEVENTLEYETNVIDTLELEQQQKILLKLIKQLTSEQQVVLKLKFFEDLDNREIAKILNKNEGAIRVIQHRAVSRLQELLKASPENNLKQTNEQ
jgi:RNA polymerase sigma-70 factor (ECF subfamily)